MQVWVVSSVGRAADFLSVGREFESLTTHQLDTHIAGSLAQLVEQRTLNPLVAGSTPSQPTIWMLSSVWLEHLPYKQRVIGSSPIASTIHHRPIPQFFKIDKRRDDLSFCLLFSVFCYHIFTSKVCVEIELNLFFNFIYVFAFLSAFIKTVAEIFRFITAKFAEIICTFTKILNGHIFTTI